ncbi:pyrroline-5-carboxylate reductase [Xanthovirga aplysinae]|uniref:pyrroline-5-carboxylate reductase n=1 Tax=Xanthovirga aplysinae TaxID=2529853 RepID=UPI0012BB9224|nr:pyrroline-5-carboxylate reductase [Xanthovirga aplysinae]MTI33560.1 pyrroline-5-carboxylate reductase [Xanthovirga aplysinae]
MENLTISIIGCGNLGLSVTQGLLKGNQITPNQLTITKRNLSPILFLQEKGVKVLSNNIQAVRDSQLVVIAVKPYNVKDVLEEIRDELDPERHVLVSLATGITTDEIAQHIGKTIPIFRAMPNIATDIRESITCICHKAANGEEMQQVEWLFNHLGVSIQINEELMEAATILGACGIAYVLRFIRAMIQGGIQIGFDAKTANAIVNQTVKGAAELLITNNDHPEREIDKVTTPKGCTIVGLNEMEHQGFSSSLIKGIVASFEKIEN